MPIKPENRARYPKNWSEIRAKKRLDAGDRCEGCGVPNYATGYRDDNGVFCYIDAALIKLWKLTEQRWKTFKIVLTVAHLDHQPENCAPDNLRLWCQKCHLNYDQEHHAQTRYQTKMANRNTLELPL